MIAGNEVLPTGNGWARRHDTHSIVWHYFVGGRSICAKQWADPVLPVTASVYDGKTCPRCVAIRTLA